jgi:predicted lipoprotein with Yx(FWY)xxD motif
VSKLALIFGTVLTIAVLAGCGGSSSAGNTPAKAAEASTQAVPTSKRKGPRLKVADSDYGRILFDGRGRALYLFTADTGKASTCSGDCAAAWPPWIVKRKPRAASGVKGALIGTTRRDGGSLQATYRNHPLYYYVGDRAPGEVKCQAVFEFGGNWYVVRSSGHPVR